MSLSRLVDIVHSGWQTGWTGRNKEALSPLFEGPDRPAPGFLMQAAAEAHKDPAHGSLLHIDEINPAELGKIPGGRSSFLACAYPQ
jgi:hypothetical protein